MPRFNIKFSSLTNMNNIFKIEMLWKVLIVILIYCFTFILLISYFPNEFSVAEASDTKPLGALEIGDRVVDLSWEWEFRLGEDYSNEIWGKKTPPGKIKPVIWIIVAKDHYRDGSGVTLLSEELIGHYTFDNSTDRGDYYGSNHWGYSGTTNADRGLRPWLNSNGIHTGEGFYHAFSATFKNNINTVNIPNRSWQSGEPYITEDRVFVPSTTELGDLRKYDGKDSYVVGEVYPFFIGASSSKWGAILSGSEMAGIGAPGQGDYQFYWTRTPSKVISRWVLHVGFGEGAGSIVNLSDVAVRPALNLRSETSVSATPNAEGIYEIIGGIALENSTEEQPDDDAIKTGTHKVAYIPVKYKGSDSPLPDFTVANLMTRAGMVSYYYYQQSYGAVNIESEFVYDYWKELPNTYSYYEQQASGGPFWVLGTRVIADAIEIAGINVDDYDAVVVIQPALKRAFADSFISTTTVFLAQTDNYGTWAHELGHAVFKWPDYYHEKDRLNTRGATGSWCLMGTGNQLSPPAPIMIYNKVSAGWLRFKDIYLNVVYPLNITLIENLNQGNEVYRYNTERDDIKYIIIEGRKPTDGVIVEDSWYKPPFYKPTMLDDEGIQLYQVEIKNGDEYVYYIESKRSNNRFQRVTLVPGDSYDCDLCSTSFNALNDGAEIQIDIQPLPVTSRKIFKLSAVDYQYSNVKDIAATPNITENVFDIDLHLYTNDGSKVGMDYETGEYLLQIPGARSSGNIPGGAIEWVSIPDNIEAFYKIDTTPMEIWLDELVRLGQFDAEDIEGIDFEIEATVQEIVVDEFGERSVSEITEILKIAKNNSLKNNYFSKENNSRYLILATLFFVVIIIAIIIRATIRDIRLHEQSQ